MLGLEAERRSLGVSVFGAKSIVTDSKTVTVHLESLDGGTKTEVFLWNAPNICEMKAVDWSHSARSLNHLCDLEIPKPVAHGEVDILNGSDYYEELLLPLEHRIGKPGEPVGVKTQLGCVIGLLLDMFQEKRMSARLLTTCTRSMQTLPQTRKPNVKDMG